MTEDEEWGAATELSKDFASSVLPLFFSDEVTVPLMSKDLDGVVTSPLLKINTSLRGA
jgi:hypothetical protein